MPRPAHFQAIALTLVLGTLVSCARTGPPAPVIMGSDPAKNVVTNSLPPRIPSPSPPPSNPSPAPPAANTAPVNVAPLKIEPVTTAPPALVPQAHLPHPDQVMVAKGETLYMIARRYDLPVRSVIDANHLAPPYQISAGTSLTLPQARFHTVQSGETLYGVSRLYGVEVSTLASVNHLDAPFAIRSGQTLYLPAPSLPPEKTVLVPPATKPEVGPQETEAPQPSKPGVPSASIEPPAMKPRGARIFAWPLEGRVIESYGTGPSGTHNDGINIAARAGEPVRAADAGRVAYAGNELRGYGNLVLIKHSGGYMTAYAHNAKLLVKRGEAVKRGQEIAKAGATGTVHSPQLHFEIRQGTRALDPASFLPSLRASAD